MARSKHPAQKDADKKSQEAGFKNATEEAKYYNDIRTRAEEKAVEAYASPAQRTKAGDDAVEKEMKKRKSK